MFGNKQETQVTQSCAVPSSYRPLSLIAAYLYKQFDRISSFLISTSLFLAINGSLKVFFSGLLYNIFFLNMVLITFLITFSIYGLNKLTDLKEDSINTPERAKTIKKIELLFRLSVIISFFLSLIIGFFENIFILPVILFPLLLGILYSVRFSSKLPRLKDITGVKNLTIALSWAVTSTFLPAIYLSEKKIELILLIFYLFFMKSYINSIIFDVRDIEGDRLNGIRTIPVVLGLARTKNLLLLFNSTLVIWLFIINLYIPEYTIILLFAVGYGFWYIFHFCRPGIKPGKSLDLLVDGEFIIIASCILFFAQVKWF